MQSAGVLSILKLVGVDRESGKRLDEILVFPFPNGRSFDCDATSLDTYDEIDIYSSAVSVGHEAKKPNY